jgi:hypothetical protein
MHGNPEKSGHLRLLFRGKSSAHGKAEERLLPLFFRGTTW